MKRLLAGTLLGILAGISCAHAQTAAADPAETQTWEQLTQAQRDQIIAPLRERWNANPDERARMLERARRWQAMPPDQRTRAQRGMKRWEHMDPAKREQMRTLFESTRDMPKQQRREAFALFHAMREMTPEQREALKLEWQKMTPAQRAQWMREHAPRRVRHDGRHDSRHEHERGDDGA